MQIEKSQLNDVDLIFELYQIATDYMRSKGQVCWPKFPDELIVNSINEGRQWKLVIEGKIACIWTIALDDELIWGAKNNEPSLYLHRIATHPDFRGRNLVSVLIDWANGYCKENKLQYIRMDTVGLNKGLISHYQKLGFEFLGSKYLENTNGLPLHYQDGEVCYFQKVVL